jgi:preprotein translocase subunit YajC
MALDLMALWPFAQGGDELNQSPVPMLLMMGIIFGIMYFLVLRPQAQQEKQRRGLVDGLKRNDRVITKGGIVGVVVSVHGDELVLRVDEDKNTRIRFLKDAIASLNEAGTSKEKTT